MRHGELKHIFDALERAFVALGIDFYLIGALARQVWYERSGKTFRTTKDIDYAALISSQQEYEEVKTYLIDKEAFTESKGNAFVLFAPDGTQVDILPFGEIESDGAVEISGNGMTNIKVDGMKEVYDAGTETVDFDTGNTFKVATLPAIALLKFIAYDDRPEQRQKDVIDITNLMLHFFDLSNDLIYDYHNDLFDETKMPRFESIGPIVLGREIRKIAQSKDKLVERLEGIMARHIALNENSPFIRLMVQVADDADVELMAGYLSDILWGFRNASAIDQETNQKQ